MKRRDELMKGEEKSSTVRAATSVLTNTITFYTLFEMAKKKKPTLKSNVNRGFATTSLPSKKEDSETTSNPNTNPTSSAISTKGNSTPADPVTASPSVDQKNHADQIIKAMNQAGSENRGRGNGETFDLSKVREQELQSLVDKLADKVDKEVAKTYKVSILFIPKW